MTRFMDFHEDLQLPAEAIAQLAEDTHNARADQFGVRQIELYHNADGKVYCLLDGPDEQAIRAPRPAGSALRRRPPSGQPHLINDNRDQLARAIGHFAGVIVGCLPWRSRHRLRHHRLAAEDARGNRACPAPGWPFTQWPVQYLGAESLDQQPGAASGSSGLPRPKRFQRPLEGAA